MVDVETYGVWSARTHSVKKSVDKLRIIVTWYEDTGDLYSFVEQGGSVTEFSRDDGEYPLEVMERVMKRESHGEDIVDVLEDEGFEVDY